MEGFDMIGTHGSRHRRRLCAATRPRADDTGAGAVRGAASVGEGGDRPGACGAARMTALWCDPWQVHALPCGCAARQPDWSQTWVPLRPCRAHADLIAWALVLRTLPEGRGNIFQPPLPLDVPPYEQEVRCRCCGLRVDWRPCDCEPTECRALHNHVNPEQRSCTAHCQPDPPEDADGHPEPDEDLTW